MATDPANRKRIEILGWSESVERCGTSWPRVAIAITAGIGLALASLMQSLSNLTEKTQPQLSTILWPQNDRAWGLRASFEMARSEAAHQMSDKRELKSEKTQELDRVRFFARKALYISAYNSEGLRNLAYVELVRGHDAAALSYAQAAARLSRRDAAAQLLLMRSALINSNFPVALKHFDIALRTTSNARDQMFPLLASALTSDALRADFEPYMRSENPWLADFFVFALRAAPDKPLIGRLIRDAPALPERTGASVRAMAVPYMVQEGEVALAREIANKLPDATRPAPNGGLSDPQLSLTRDLPAPFGWAHADDGTVDVHMGPPLAITSEYSYRGMLLRQLVTLSPGTYRLSAPGSYSPGTGWSVTCTSVANVLAAGIRSDPSTFTVPEAGCPGQWITFLAEGRAPVDATIQGISIEPFGRVLR